LAPARHSQFPPTSAIIELHRIVPNLAERRAVPNFLLPTCAGARRIASDRKTSLKCGALAVDKKTVDARMPHGGPSHGLSVRRRRESGTTSKIERLLTGILAVLLGWASQSVARAQESPRANWTSADTPCAKYNDLGMRLLGNIGVKVDAKAPWADGFRRALSFWNTVLAANFHEEADLSACAVRIVDGDRGILNHGIVARSQNMERSDFRGKIAVDSAAAKKLSEAEIYGIAVHELGHMLGLKHNPSSGSIMYYLNISGKEVVESQDIAALSRRHELRPNITSSSFLSIEVFQPETPALAKSTPQVDSQ
jgi:Matrixin